jgi:hypothetical protein
MNRPKLSAIGVLLLVCLAAGLYWQHRQLRHLQGDHARLLVNTAELDSLRDEFSRLRQSQADSAELERLRQGQAELLRLRSEASRLRQQLKEAQQASGGARIKQESSPAVFGEETPAPIETFKATVRSTLAAGQTLVTGGWVTPDGKRGLVLVDPIIFGNPGEARQVTLQARLVALPDDVLGEIGLEAQRCGDKETSAATILNPDQSAALLQRLEGTAGVDVLAAPKVSTLDGRQAQVRLVRVQTAGESPTDLGHTIDFVPHVSPDGASLDLTVIAQLKLQTPNAR